MKENEALVCVFRGESFEAEVVKGRLEDSGIMAMIENHSMGILFSTYSVVSGPVCVLVKPENAQQALRIIEDKDENA